MATILLSAAGAALGSTLGGAVGGTIAGLSTTILGRAVGATIGNVLDQRLMGAGAEPVEQGRVDRFRLSGAGEGAPVAQVFGAMRVGGQVIWASDFLETVATSGGGKGAPQTLVSQYSYSVSLAIGLCAGEILTVGRVWADGEEVARDDLNLRVYPGSADQLPDPLIEAIEGAGMVPAYRGTAYVVMEDLALERFGNRVPQFSFEVIRAEQPDAPGYAEDPTQAVQAVALMPGTGEYALATTPVYYSDGPASQWAANVNTPSGKTDFETSVEMLGEQLPNCTAASLVVSWFGGDLRCASCDLRPKVERTDAEGSRPWSVAGETRATASAIAQEDGRPIYGGTPSDASVVEAIRHLNASGKGVMFYPFILMDQQAGNGLPDPWSDADDQPALPWRGRITLSGAPGRAGSPDGTATAEAEVAAFFGTATAADFTVGDGVVTYTGPVDWGLRRFILHYAALCAAAGGVEAFCIASEMRSLTQIRGAGGQFAAVDALRDLAGEVRALLGPSVRIGYAADWSEYFGHHPQDGSGDVFFHRDPLWADPETDFIGIDNYMPLSDWRDGSDHADAPFGAIHAPEYLRGNVEGGEGYDWYYHSDEARAAQIRTDITDGEGEPWVFRFKDIRNWWQNAHHDRIGGVRQAAPTAWVPQSKPIWFTEIGCAAIDKGTNQPNKFLDPKSSESALPYFSSGARDDLIQAQYLRSMLGYWAEPGRNPVSEVYAGPMLDMSRAFVWAWDARPFPAFPNNADLWSDGENWARGHWLNGRMGARTLASVVREICAESGLQAVATDTLFGQVRGYVVADTGNARAALQPLLLAYGFDAVERDGVLAFLPRDGEAARDVPLEGLAETGEAGVSERSRAGEAEMSGRIRLRFVQADADFEVIAEEAVRPEDATHAVATSDLSLALTRGEAHALAARWLAEAIVARDTVRFALPPSSMDVRAGDVVSLEGEAGAPAARFRVDRVEMTDLQQVEAVRIEPELYRAPVIDDDLPALRAFSPPLPVTPLFMDLPLLTGDEVAHAPHLAVAADPWSGSAAVYAAPEDADYQLDRILRARAVAGLTQNPLPAHAAGRWDLGAPLEVKLVSGALESRSREAVLNGANLAVIGDGSGGNWEVFQFETAELVGERTYWLSNRLRGQQGSDGLMPDQWPVGSWVVLLDGTAEQIALASSQLRIARHYRIGPASRAYTDPAYAHVVAAFDGNGLRPYAPAHLHATIGFGGDLEISWIRRTRIDGDSWDLADVPLGEESEQYLLRARKGGTVLREVTLNAPVWTYSAADQAADAGAEAIEVAQVSARYGPGLFARLPLIA